MAVSANMSHVGRHQLENSTLTFQELPQFLHTFTEPPK